MIKRRLNRKPAKPVPNARLYNQLGMISPAITLPSFVNKQKYCSPVKDQGDEGSCTSFAGSASVEYLQNVEIAHKVTGLAGSLIFTPGQFTPVSESFIYWNEREMDGDPEQDGGSSLSTCSQVLEQLGVCREQIWPYHDATMYKKPPVDCYTEAAKHKVLHAYQISTLFEMRHSLAQGFPFIFGITVYDSFMSGQVARTGIIPMPDTNRESVQGGHALFMVGYNDAEKMFLLRNSWGTGWGQAGYAWIPYAYMTDPRLAEDLWTLRYVAAKV